MTDIERYITAAENHGEFDDPDHEVGDLQELLRLAWGLMTEEQRRRFVASDETQFILELGRMVTE